MSQPLVIAAPDVIAEQQRWLAQLTDERRLSPKTADAYERDLRQFLGFLTGHLGGHNFQWAWASGWCAGQYV